MMRSSCASLGVRIGMRSSAASSSPRTVRRSIAEPSKTGTTSFPESWASVRRASRRTFPPVDASSTATMGNRAPGSRSRYRLLPGSLPRRSNDSDRRSGGGSDPSRIRRAETEYGNGTRALLWSSQVTRRYRNSPGVNPSSSCLSFSSGKSKNVPSGINSVQRLRSPPPSNRTRFKNGAGSPAMRSRSILRDRPRSTSNPLVFLVEATGKTRPSDHRGSGTDGATSRYGTSLPVASWILRSARPPRGRISVSPAGAMRICDDLGKGADRESNGTSMSRRFGPLAPGITGRSY